MRYLLLILVSALLHHRAKTVDAGPSDRVISAYNTAYDNCKYITESSSPLSKASADYRCEQAFRALDSIQLNSCPNWQHPGCRPVEEGQPYQCTCMVSNCDEISIRKIAVPLRVCGKELWNREQRSARNDYSDALTIANSRRYFSYSDDQAGCSGSAQSPGGAGGSGGVYYPSGEAGGPNSMNIAGSYVYPDGAYPIFAPGISSGATTSRARKAPLPYSCSQCTGKFRSQRSLYNHKKVYHTVASPTHCYLCNISFAFRKGFIAHLRKRHPGIAEEEEERQNVEAGEVEEFMPYVCPVCKKRYSGAHGLRDHMKSHTTDDTTCHVCTKVLSTKANLKRHLSKEHPEVPVPEPTGGPTTIKQSKLGPFACPTCGKTYTHKKNMKDHAKSHGTLETVCAACNRTYASKQSYTVHMQREHPLLAKAEKEVQSKQRDKRKPVKCKMCNKGFKDNEYLRRHMEFHEGKTTCNLCGTLFQSATSLYFHKKKEHK